MDLLRAKLRKPAKSTSTSQSKLATLDVRNKLFPNRLVNRAASTGVLSPPPTYHDSQKSLEGQQVPAVTSRSILRSVHRSRSEPTFADVRAARSREGRAHVDIGVAHLLLIKRQCEFNL